MVWSKQFQTALYCLDGVGPATFRSILKTLTEHELTESDFWVNRAGLWQKMSLSENIVESIRKFKKEHNSSSYFSALLAQDIRVVFPQNKEFPILLKETENFPPLLFARGKKLTGQEAFLAVVGTRNITAYGERVVDEFIPTLVRFGKTIASGFMYGVDVAAQSGAIKAEGQTVGVLGFGFDHMYPPKQQALFEWFLQQGATFFSPFAPHVPPLPGNFPHRNTVVAGMSEGVLVVEGARRSGSLITAHAAVDFGREVWAVSGSIFNQYSEGTQILINEGAQLVRCPEDVLGITPTKNKNTRAKKPAWSAFSDLKKSVCELLDMESLPTNYLAKKLNCSVVELSATLVELELLGVIVQTGNTWSLV